MKVDNDLNENNFDNAILIDNILQPNVDIPVINPGISISNPNSKGDSILEQIELLLNSKYLFRYNIVSNKVEFKLNGRDEIPYVDMTDYDYNSILRFIKKRGLSCSISTLRNILQSSFVSIYNPYADLESNLLEWDGKTDYIEMLAATVTTTTDENWRRWFKKWYVAMVASWVDEKTINHTAIIFCGAQGIGKTTWLSKLVPVQLKKYVYAGNLNVRDKDSQVKLSECCIIIMDELENASRNLDALKELITKSDIYVRRAYAFTHEKISRRASFAGSVNNIDFLHDVTGNRRFLCFEVIAIDIQHKVNIEMAVSQALAMVKNGFQYWFDKDEIAELEVHNQEFRAIIIEEEQLETYFEKCELGAEGAVFMKTTDLLKQLLRLSGLKYMSDQKLGRVLNAKKFVRSKQRGNYGYWLKPVVQHNQ